MTEVDLAKLCPVNSCAYEPCVTRLGHMTGAALLRPSCFFIFLGASTRREDQNLLNPPRTKHSGKQTKRQSRDEILMELSNSDTIQLDLGLCTEIQSVSLCSTDPPPSPSPHRASEIPSESFHAACCRTLLGCFGLGLMLMKTSSCSMSAVMHCGSTSMSSLMSNINTRGRQPCGVSTEKKKKKISTSSHAWRVAPTHRSLEIIASAVQGAAATSPPPLPPRLNHYYPDRQTQIFTAGLVPSESLGNSTKTNLFGVMATASAADLFILGFGCCAALLSCAWV